MKASVLFGAGWEDDSLEVLWRDAGRAFCKVRRNGVGGERHAFIPVPFGTDHPTIEGARRLAHEHELQPCLDSAWALRPLELVRDRGQTLLVVDYTGGEPLDRVIGQPMEMGQFLRLSVALAGAVRQLHGSGLIHKDIKPSNVLTSMHWLSPARQRRRSFQKRRGLRTSD